MEPVNPSRVYSPDEAATILGVSRDDVSVLLRDHVLLEDTDADGTWGISGTSLLAELEFQRSAPRWRKIARRLSRDLPL